MNDKTKEFNDDDFDISKHSIIENAQMGRELKLGRPNLEQEKKRSKRVFANLTDYEYEQFIQKLGRDIKPTTWLRNVILDYIDSNK